MTVESFEAKLAADKKIEPNDEMPDEYRNAALRMMKFHASSEIVGAIPEAEWIPYAPSLFRKRVLIAKVQDEVGHGQILMRVVEDLGCSREQFIQDILDDKAKYLTVFDEEYESWADIGMIGWLGDGAEIERQHTLKDASYGPYARAMHKIVYEEAFHYSQGRDLIATLMQGTKAQRDMVQESFNKWWWRAMVLFGPHDSESTHSKVLMNFKLKIKSNDELRNLFLNKFVPRIKKMGLEIPDQTLQYDESKGSWKYKDPDFTIYKNSKSLPSHQRRLKFLRQSYETNGWVRRLVELDNIPKAL
ncbi:1,2-phenylacetyl-CoA epoxidase subunit A [Peribacillus cavernae]|uniref:1,2-phenylacetyl-CoA epoxidase subunit A n=1 Tax=Peribacillus cavernae TaxID=1674310 RepID=A0A433HWN4_9BACI|nr:1,2-phenylacetyl-CoA epoxidase subunit PaaA [Peribacillus cavernae]MDQ0218094.1 ring-1,2-phenylacetyl-CoA epoxidase subunit PaaA [Peribacillus cavernae]RUQ32749.1 1,2-phenylacetyl-CoA epoxidase subunit A [Peribacillus cavernae]